MIGAPDGSAVRTCLVQRFSASLQLLEEEEERRRRRRKKKKGREKILDDQIRQSSMANFRTTV
jgi:hypothetical protein